MSSGVLTEQVSQMVPCALDFFLLKKCVRLFFVLILIKYSVVHVILHVLFGYVSLLIFVSFYPFKGNNTHDVAVKPLSLTA